jgi:hypothetical protein
LENQKIKEGLPSNYEELKKAANRTSNWRERLNAVDELGKWNSKQTIYILKHRLENDSVTKIQEAAYRHLKELGENIESPPKKIGDLIKGLTKILVRVKKSLPEGHTYEEFKEKLKKMRIDLYDTYEGEKGSEFDTWLEEKWASLITKKY